MGPFVDEPPAGLVVGDEAVVGDDFEGGEVAEFSVAIVSDTGDDEFDVFFGGAGAFDVGEGASDAGVVLAGDFFEVVAEGAEEGEFGDGGVGALGAVVLAGFVGDADELDGGSGEEGDVFFGFAGGLLHGLLGEGEGGFSGLAGELRMVVEPGEEGVAIEKESGA